MRRDVRGPSGTIHPIARTVGTVAALLAIAAPPCPAQETIAADRPGLDFSPRTVDPGSLQFEIGLPTLSFEEGATGDRWVFQAPTLARLGVTESFEVRAGLSPYNSVSNGASGAGPAEKGVGDLEIGAKIRLTAASSPVTVAAVPSLTLPTGSGAFTSGAVGVLLNAVMGFSVADALGVAVTGGIYDVAGGEGRRTSGLAAITVSRGLSGVVGAFAEVGVFPTEDARDPALAGGGFTFLVSPDVQLDAFLSAGLSEAAPDWQFGSGVSFRF